MRMDAGADHPGLDPAPEPGDLGRLEREVERLKEQAAKAAEYLELARRQKADFLNYQDRISRERQEWKREALGDFMTDFLPALDSFTWARFEEPTLMDSLRVVEREFLRVLAKQGIAPVESLGKAFDPRLHEAVATEETDSEPEGTVLEELRRGWTMGGRVLRPAGVRVARRRAGTRPESPRKGPEAA